MVLLIPRSIPTRPYVLTPDGWDTVWQAAKANSGSAMASVCFMGDSIQAGFGASDCMSTTYPYLLRTALLAKYGHYGDYWPLMLNTRFSPLSGTPPFVVPASPLPTYLPDGYFDSAIWTPLVSAGTTMATFVSPYTCQAMEWHYIDWATGNFQYTVDGGGAQTITTGVAPVGACKVVSTAMTGLSNAVHTVILNGTNTAICFFMQGMACYKVSKATNSGLGFMHQYSNGLGMTDKLASTLPLPVGNTYNQFSIFSGQRNLGAIIVSSTNATPIVVTTSTHGLVDGDDIYINGHLTNTNANGRWYVDVLSSTTFALYQRANLTVGAVGTGSAGGATGTVVTQNGFGFPMQPSLVVWSLGINDLVNGRGVHAFINSIKRQFDAFRAGAPNCSILVVVEPNPNLESSDQTTAFGDSNSWYMYQQFLIDMAYQYSAAVYNAHGHFGQYANGNGLVTSNVDPHPTDTGHALINSMIAPLIV